MSMGTSLALSWDLQGYGRCGCRKVSGMVVRAHHSAPPLQPQLSCVTLILVSFLLLPFYTITMFALWVPRKFWEVTAQALS